MNSRLSSSLINNLTEFDMDSSIGPAVASDIRAFDFTVLFEEAILKLLPWCLFLAIVPLRVKHLFRQPKKVAVAGFDLCAMKGVCALS